MRQIDIVDAMYSRLFRAFWCLIVSLNIVGCAQDQKNFVADGWAGAPQAQRIVVLPTNFDATPPNYLAPGTERLTQVVAKRIEDSGRTVVRVPPSGALAAARQSLRDLGLNKKYRPKKVRPHLSQNLASQHSADLVIISTVVVRDAEGAGSSVSWDGAEQQFWSHKLPARISATKRPKGIALSLHVLGFDARGEPVFEAYGGLELAYAVRMVGRDTYRVTQRDKLLEDAGVLSAGVERAFSDLLGRWSEGEVHADAVRAGRGLQIWRRARTGPFLVTSNASQAVSEHIATQANQFLEVAEKVTGLSLDPSVMIDVIAFGREDEFRKYHGKYVQGIATQTRDGTRVAILAESSRMRLSVLYHEIIHAMLYHDPNMVYPVWYHEGLAEWMGAIAIQGDLASLNLPPTHRRISLESHSALPLAELMDRRSFADLWPDEIERHYTDAWALVLFLHASYLDGGEDYRRI